MITSQDSLLTKVRSIDAVLKDIARDRPDHFPLLFRRIRTVYPAEVSSACIHYIAEYGLDKPGRQMLTWLCTNPDYLHLVLDPQAVSFEAAKKIFTLSQQNDPQFFKNFLDLINKRLELTQDPLLRRALDLLDDFDNPSFLARWFQRLTHHKDERIRSKVVKWICSAKPNKDLIQRHLESEDDRVRANAVEALWGIMTEEAETIFIGASGDKHHRTVANGIIGLYSINQDFALEILAKFTKHSSPMFRLAMIWVIGKIDDPSGVELLQQLNQDNSPLVRKKAQVALAHCRYYKPAVTVPPEALPASPVPQSPAKTQRQTGSRYIFSALEALKSPADPA